MKPLTLKSNVNLTGLVPQMSIAVLVVCSHLEAADDRIQDHTITSANDSTHGVNSLHSRGGFCRALDFRTHGLFFTLTPFDRANKLKALRDKIALSLPNFDVLLEDPNLPNEHLHVEWDPRTLPSQTKA